MATALWDARFFERFPSSPCFELARAHTNWDSDHIVNTRAFWGAVAAKEDLIRNDVWNEATRAMEDEAAKALYSRTRHSRLLASTTSSRVRGLATISEWTMVLVYDAHFEYAFRAVPPPHYGSRAPHYSTSVRAAATVPGA
jgi:hypothetical protein